MNTNDYETPKSKTNAPTRRQRAGPSPLATPTKPETFRLPSGRERDPYFGIGRSYWNSLVLATPSNNFKPKVKSYVIRRRGSRTGLRLIDFDSALCFIQQHEEQAKARSARVVPQGEAKVQVSEKLNCEVATIRPIPAKSTSQIDGNEVLS